MPSLEDRAAPGQTHEGDRRMEGHMYRRDENHIVSYRHIYIKTQ